MNKDTLYKCGGIPKRHDESRFKPADSKCDAWTRLYTGLKAKIGGGLLVGVVGDRGTGKTQLAACLAGHVVFNLGRPVLYKKSIEIFLEIRRGMKTSSECDAIQLYLSPFFLIIDGYEVRSESNFENNMLNYIIDKRYDNLLSTIIISNDTPESMAKSLGASILSRMQETGGIIRMTTRSFRSLENV